jgi:GTPase SAR1 family protein
MQITRGKIPTAQKIIIYGPEGIGKSTFASQFPNVIFIDTEGSTKHMDVARLPKPSSWSMLLESVKYIKTHPNECGTLTIDTADWAERLCIEDICAKYKKTGIEDFGYGKGYVYLEEEFGRLLNLLEEIIELGINVVFTAHAQMRKFEQPDEMGSYDRWEMKLEKKTAPMIKEWADMVLFANYKTYVVKTDDNKHKAQGGSRVMYTTHHACWDAKNRHNLPEEVKFDYSEIAHCIPANGSYIPSTPANVPESPAPSPAVNELAKDKPAQETKAPVEPPKQQDTKDKVAEPQQKYTEDLSGIPKPLADLMADNNVTILEIQNAVAGRGYYPKDTPISNYDSSFVSGVLVGAWPQVFQMILNSRPVPF